MAPEVQKPHIEPHKAHAIAVDLATHHWLCNSRKGGECDCYGNAGKHALAFAYIDLEEQLEAAQQRAIPPHWADVFGQVEALQTVLRQIADESYVGNYEPLEVINIYRAWAHNALLAAKEAMTEVDSFPASEPETL